MSKSIKKYYTVMVIALLIISISAALFVYQKNKQIQINQSIGVEGTEGLEDMFEDKKEDTSEDTNNNTNEPEEEKPEVKIYTNGFLCYQDAIALLNNCKGYKAITNSSCKATVLGVTETQYVRETFILSGDYYLREQIGYCTSSFGETFYRYWYSTDNGQNIKFKNTKKISSNSLEASPDWSGLKNDITVSKNDVYKYDTFAYDIFSGILPTKKTELKGSFDPTEDPKYYIVRFKLDLSTITPKYIQNIIKEGNLSGASLNSVERVFYIEKSTLFIRKVELYDSYNVQKGSVLDGVCNFSSQIIFVGVDQEYKPEMPNK